MTNPVAAKARLRTPASGIEGSSAKKSNRIKSLALQDGGQLTSRPPGRGAGGSLANGGEPLNEFLKEKHRVSQRGVSSSRVANVAKDIISPTKEDLDEWRKTPLPALSKNDELKIQKICKGWAADKLKYRGRSMEWVRDNLGSFIPGLMQSHLSDNSLYSAFIQTVRRRRAEKLPGLPEWLDVPKKDDADLRGLTYEGLIVALAVRRLSRERKQSQRNRKNKAHMSVGLG